MNNATVEVFGTKAIEPWMLPLKKAWVTHAIIVINSLVFIAMAVDSGGASILKPSAEFLTKWQLDYGPLTLDGEPWRTLTSTFVHIGILHLLCNMVVLSRVGQTCEFLYGRVKFLVLYLLAGITASVCSLLMNPDSGSVGASGAICGLIGAYAAFMMMHQKDIEPRVFTQSMKQIAVYLGCCVLFGFSVNADQAAHFGGLLAGLALGAAMAPTNNQERRFRLCDVLGIIALSGFAGILFSLEQAGTFDRSGNLAISKVSDAFHRGKDLGNAIIQIESPKIAKLDTAYANQTRASLYLEANQIKKARTSVERLLKQEPNDHTALQLGMEIAFLGHDYTRTIEITNQALESPDEPSEEKAYFAFINFFASKRLGLKDYNEKLQKTKEDLPKNCWQYKVASYLDGTISEKEFLDAAKNIDEQTESHAYAGMMKLLDGDKEKAKQFLEWVIKNGNRTFIEYNYAVGQLSDLALE